MHELTTLRNMTAIYILHQNRILLLYRIGSRVVEPSWCGIGGHFEEAELNHPLTCVIRELEEETRIKKEMLGALSLKYVTLRLKKGEIRQNYYYFAHLKDDIKLDEADLQSEEGDLRWVPLEQLMEKEMPLTARYMLQHYLDIGRYDDKLYSGTTLEENMIFTELREF